MINAVRDIKLLALHEWPVLRSTRLRALRDSPHAFTSQYLVEARWHEHEWRRRLSTARWAVASEAGIVIGIAGLVDGESPPEEPHLESIWVAPTHRRTGVSRSLVGALADQGHRLGRHELLLWVLEDNTVALRAYARLGFRPTGERQIGPDHRRYEQRLSFSLAVTSEQSAT